MLNQWAHQLIEIGKVQIDIVHYNYVTVTCINCKHYVNLAVVLWGSCFQSIRVNTATPWSYYYDTLRNGSLRKRQLVQVKR